MPKIRKTSSKLVNDLQQELLWKCSATRTYSNNIEVYTVELENYSSFGKHTATLEVNFTEANTTSSASLVVDGVSYILKTDMSGSLEPCPVGVLSGFRTVQLKGSTAYVKDCLALGTVEKTALEGHRMNHILGSQAVGGNIQDAGKKYAGNAYYCTANNELFICTADNTLTYADSSYFTSFSNLSLLNKFNNLTSSSKKTVGSFTFSFFRYNRIVSLSILASATIATTNVDVWTELFTIDSEFIPIEGINFATDSVVANSVPVEWSITANGVVRYKAPTQGRWSFGVIAYICA
jgi:hypothetical protein